MAFQEPCRDLVLSAGQVLGRAQYRGEGECVGQHRGIVGIGGGDRGEAGGMRLSKQSRLGKEFFVDISSMTKVGKSIFF